MKKMLKAGLILALLAGLTACSSPKPYSEKESLVKEMSALESFKDDSVVVRSDKRNLARLITFINRSGKQVLSYEHLLVLNPDLELEDSEDVYCELLLKDGLIKKMLISRGENQLHWATGPPPKREIFCYVWNKDVQ